MKKELELKLVNKYPGLFRYYGGNMMETCMAWGCSHGDGWYDILDNLCSKLEKYDIVLAQVKEKFGGLRVYIEGVNEDDWEEVYQMISEAEETSYKVCEYCGKPATLNNERYWWRTVCDGCEEERREKILDK